MKNVLARFRHFGGFVAGVLVGLAMTIPVFLPAGPGTEQRQMLFLFAAAILFITGITLRVATTTETSFDRRPEA